MIELIKKDDQSPDPGPLQFAVGARVRLSTLGAIYYGGVANWVPPTQGGGTDGTVVVAAFRGENKPGAEPRPYIVKWDNGVVNSYREKDLIPA